MHFFNSPLGNRREGYEMVYYDENGAYILRTTITIDGVTYHAKDYGKRAFKIYIKKSSSKKSKKVV